MWSFIGKTNRTIDLAARMPPSWNGNPMPLLCYLPAKVVLYICPCLAQLPSADSRNRWPDEFNFDYRMKTNKLPLSTLSSSSLTFNVRRTQSTKGPHHLVVGICPRALEQQTTIVPTTHMYCLQCAFEP